MWQDGYDASRQRQFLNTPTPQVRTRCPSNPARSATCGCAVEASVGVQVPPLALHALHQHIWLRQVGDGPPVRGSCLWRELQSFTKLPGAHLRSSCLEARCLSIPGTSVQAGCCQLDI